MCIVVANTKVGNFGRMAACLQIKNYLTSNNHAKCQEHQRNWLAISPTDRMEIKNNAFSALGTEQK